MTQPVIRRDIFKFFWWHLGMITCQSIKAQKRSHTKYHVFLLSRISQQIDRWINLFSITFSSWGKVHNFLWDNLTISRDRAYTHDEHRIVLVLFFYFHFGFHYSTSTFSLFSVWLGFHYSTSTCGADKRTVAVVMTVKVVKVMRQNLEIFKFYYQLLQHI